MIIYSQEYMRYFFADNDSNVQPLPASGMSLFLARDVKKGTRFSSILTLPLREEEVRKVNQEAFKYYYPKLAMIGVEVSHHVYLNFGLGYSGNVKTGAWFFPFGISYRLVDESSSI
ncbi:hypothetical protein EBU99_05460 [bacterium]|nr:hypothetical protein [bacterium]